jgi:glycerophosphoryl diester phosphodiesterase
MNRKILIYFIAITLSVSCQKKEISDNIDNLNNGKITIIGHGGVSFPNFKNPLPLDCWTSIQKTIDVYNADGVDADVTISQDGKFIVFHNELLESCTNCSGCIYEKKADEITKCKYKEDYDINLVNSEKVITLDSILSYYSKRVLHPEIVIDIKSHYACNTVPSNDFLVTNLSNLLSEYSALPWTSIICQDTSIIKDLQLKNPGLRILIDGAFESSLDFAVKNDLYGISINNNSVSKTQIKTAHEHNVRVLIFGVKIKSGIIDAINKNPDIIDTDNIALTQQILL